MSSNLNNQGKYGNRPDGYPKNNKGFDEAAEKVVERRAEDTRQAKMFLEKLEESLREDHD